MRIDLLNRRKRALRAAYHTVFGSPDGRLVLDDILQGAGVLQTSFVEGDAHSTSFNEGARRLALKILDRLSWSEGELRKLGERITANRLQTMSADTDQTEIGDE